MGPLPVAIALGAVDQFVETRPHRPGDGELPHQSCLPATGSRSSVCWALPEPPFLEGSHVAQGGHACAQQRALILRVRWGSSERSSRAGTPLHAELVVQAAIALVGQVRRQRLQARARDTRGGRGRASHQVGHCAEIAGSIGNHLQQTRTRAEGALRVLPAAPRPARWIIGASSSSAGPR